MEMHSRLGFLYSNQDVLSEFPVSECEQPISRTPKKIWLNACLIVLLVLFMLVAVVGASWVAFIEKSNQMVLQSMRTELLINIRAIKEAQENYYREHNHYVECDPYPAFPQKGTQDWEKLDSGGFYTINWAPEVDVRGSYRVSVSDDDFTVTGISDVDGDGVYATAVATKSQNVDLITDLDIY